jgi:ketosteroid isomerase-like protein
MSEHGPLASAYIEAAEKFSTGDTDGWGALLADNCTFDGNRARVGSSASEIVARLKDLREQVGWTAHEVLESSEGDDVVALLARNTFGDGTTMFTAGCARFRDGKIIEMHGTGGLPRPK